PAPALAALNFGREHTHAAVAVLILHPPRHLRLDIVEGGRIDDGFVVALHIILRHLALVFLCLLLEKVHCELLLQEGVAFVLLIGKDTADGALAPDCLAARSRKFPPRQFLGDGVAVMPICVALEKYSRILLQRLSSFAEPL